MDTVFLTLGVNRQGECLSRTLLAVAGVSNASVRV